MKDEYDAGIIAKLERALAVRDQLRDMQVQLREQRDEPEYESRSNARGDDTNPIWVLYLPAWAGRCFPDQSWKRPALTLNAIDAERLSWTRNVGLAA